MKEAISDWMGEGIKGSAIILVITAAGGSFGAILGKSPIVDFIKQNMATLPLGILIPFIIAAALKTAQGSSTVAIVTTPVILSPMLATLGLDPAPHRNRDRLRCHGSVARERFVLLGRLAVLPNDGQYGIQSVYIRDCVEVCRGYHRSPRDVVIF
jgi:hypothetical protein